MSPPRLDRGAPPSGGSPRAFAFPRFERRTLPDGPELITAPLPHSPLAVLMLLFPAGAELDSPGAAGLASFTSALLDEGTTRRDALTIAADVERLGGQLATGVDWSLASISVQVLPRRLEGALDILADVATAPTFPPDEVERTRRHRLTDLLRRRDQPGTVAADHLAQAVFGEGPFGFPVLGTPDAIGSLERERVLGFFGDHYDLRQGTLLAAGSFEPAALYDAVARVFPAASPRGNGPTTPRPSPPVEAPGRRIVVVDRPGGAQTEIRVGHAGPSRLDPDWNALSLLNTLFGGKFTSRINLNLREVHGFTYGASSRLVARRGPSLFSVATAVANVVAGRAVGEILGELERLQNEPVQPEELEETRNYLLGVFPYTLQTADAIVRHLEGLVAFGLPDDYYSLEKYLARLHAADVDELLAVARRQLHPERAVIVAVGPAAELVPQLEHLGPIEVVVR